MSKRTVFTTITPLPPDVSRQVAISFLQDHLRMIDLNPLVIARHPISCPANAPPDELHCAWYSLTDRVSYLPGGRVTGQVSYTAAFNNVPTGVQTHVYAPMGLNIRETWTVAGNLPGEPVEPVELGIGAPLSGLYVREDVDMRCNVLMAAFVKKTLKKAHSSLVDAIRVEAQVASAASPSPVTASAANAPSPHPSKSPSGNTIARYPPLHPPPYDPVSPPISPAFSFTASPTTSRRLSMDDKDQGLLIDHTLYRLPPIQTDLTRPKSTTTETITAANITCEFDSGDDKDGSNSRILARLTTNLPAYLPAPSSPFTSSPTLNNPESSTNESPSSGPPSAFPSPLRLSRRPTSASFYPSTPHEEATRPSPSARFTAWQPLKPAVSIVTRYPRAKDQDYSDIAASNPFDSPVSSGKETSLPPLPLQQEQQLQKLTTPALTPASLPAPAVYSTTSAEEEDPPASLTIGYYRGVREEKEPALDLAALGILSAGRTRLLHLEVQPKKTYSAYIPPPSSSPAAPSLTKKREEDRPVRYDGIGPALTEPPGTEWYY